MKCKKENRNWQRNYQRGIQTCLEKIQAAPSKSLFFQLDKTQYVITMNLYICSLYQLGSLQ